MARKNIIVTQESKTGRNLVFRDPTKKQDMSRAEFVKRIEKGEYDGYHVRKVNGTKNPPAIRIVRKRTTLADKAFRTV